MSDKNKYFSFGTFRVEIPSVVNNANVNPTNYNIIKNNGDYNIPEGYTGWNNFKVDVEKSTTVDDNEVNITIPAEPDFDPNGDPYTLEIGNFNDENNPLITWNQFDEKYATTINLDLGEFVEQLYRELKLENGQVILENGEYQIYDYEKDNDLDIKKKTLKLSRGVIDDPSYRNIGSFRVNVPTSSNISLQNKIVNIYQNGQRTINPDNNYNGLGQVIINTNVLNPPINLQNKTINITQNGNYSISADNNYDGLGTVNINAEISSSGNLQPSKSVTIRDNGYHTILPDQGYNGFSRVDLEVNVASSSNTDNQIKYFRFEYPTDNGDVALSDYKEFGTNTNYPKTITNYYSPITDHNIICVSQTTRYGIIGNDAVWYSFQIIRNDGTQYQLQNDIGFKTKVWSFTLPNDINLNQWKTNNGTRIYFYDKNYNLIGSDYPLFHSINMSSTLDVFLINSWAASDLTINAASILSF